MAKRFTDTEKWKKPFIRSLQGAYKLLWMYILDDCDHAGIWHVDIEVAALRIGATEIDTDEALKQFKDKIISFDSGEKWFIPDFIDFQYNCEPQNLNPMNKTHNSVRKILEKYNLLEKVVTTTSKTKESASPLQGAKDKDKDKDKEMDKDKGGVGEIEEDMFEDEIILEAEYVNDDVFNEEEYTEAVKYLLKHTLYPLIQQHHSVRADEVLRLFRLFYEQKLGFKELSGKTQNDVIKNFYYWVPKYQAAGKPKPEENTSKVRKAVDAATARHAQYKKNAQPST